jgi:lipoprotein-releasing system permease protein
MSFSYFITKKYTLSKRESGFINLVSVIAVTGISLGVATLIIALSILSGFEKTLTEKIIDFDSHIQISSYKSVLTDYNKSINGLKSLLPPGTRISAFAENIAVISSRKVQEGVNIKGITIDNSTLRLKENIKSGSFDLSPNSDGTGKIIIGKKLASKLRIKLNDRVTVFALAHNKLPSATNLPNIQKFTVSGIFESDMAEYDDLFAYVELEAARNLFNMNEAGVTGYDIKVSDITKIDSLTNFLNNELLYPFFARSIYQTHRNIFTWIDLQKKPIPIILGLIIIVAVFNIIGTLLMIVLEKTSAIGILKSLGAKKGQITRIFVYQGMFLALIGIAAGNLLAFTLTYLQYHYRFIHIPSSVYFMSSVPVMIKPENFILISVITFLLCIVAALIPSYIASKIKPVSTLRFN